MNPRKKHALIIAAIVALTVFAITTLSVWILGSNQKPTTPPTLTISPAPSQTTASGPCKDFETFEYAKYPISCKKAIDIVLTYAPGTIQKISVEPTQTAIPSSSGSIEIQTVEMWLIDINLTTPYFDRTFEREIKVLRIGIRTDEHKGIYKKPLE